MSTLVKDISLQVENCLKELELSIPYHKLKIANSPILILDGTSCCFKTSIINYTNLPVYKNQLFNKIKNPNSYPLSHIGFAASGFVDSKFVNEPTIYDRNINNNGEWDLLWCMMGEFNSKFGNVPFNLNDKLIGEFYEHTFKTLFDTYKNSTIFKYFNTNTNTLCIINSNSDKVDKLRSLRNVGSDVERSNWNYYTSMQNSMYKILYENCIDLNKFEHYTNDCIIQSISIYINNFFKLYEFDKKPSNTPFIKISLPMYEDLNDLVATNMTAHVNRQMRRVGCRYIINQATCKKTEGCENIESDEDSMDGFSDNFWDAMNIPYGFTCQQYLEMPHGFKFIKS